MITLWESSQTVEKSTIEFDDSHHKTSVGWGKAGPSQPCLITEG